MSYEELERLADLLEKMARHEKLELAESERHAIIKVINTVDLLALQRKP
jgi:hypothetical protein